MHFFIQLGLQGAGAAREPVKPRCLCLLLLLNLSLPAVSLEAILCGLVHNRGVLSGLVNPLLGGGHLLANLHHTFLLVRLSALFEDDRLLVLRRGLASLIRPWLRALHCTSHTHPYRLCT